MLLALVSGLLGIVVGVAATAQNLRVFRRSSSRYRRTFVVTIVAFVLVGLVSLGSLFFAGVADQAATDKAVARFHEQLNSGSVEDIVAESDPLFTSKTTRAAAVDFLSILHTKLGSESSAHVESWSENRQINGPIGSGSFMQITYTTQFANGPATEQFVWRVTDDHRLLLVSYRIESPVFLR
jgi:hypothetical protein